MIEYRVWDNIEQIYLEEERKFSYHLLPCGLIEYSTGWNGCKEPCNFVVDRDNRFVVEQYTGLKDNTKWEELTETEKLKADETSKEWKGKKIYAGDIIIFASHQKYEVILYEGKFCVRNDSNILPLPYHYAFYRIIGNIHD